MNTKEQTKQNSDELTVACYDYNKGLNSYASFKLNDSALGEDLVQDTFTKTWAYLVKGGKIVLMKAFLYHILNNLIVDQYRKQNHKMESLDTLAEKGFEPKDEASEHVSNFLDGTAAMRRIAMLPETYRKVMRMHFAQSMPFKEISLITGQTRNAIAVQIHRGVQKLKILCGTKVSLDRV
ncbi:MAG: RNA polymerase sigma factor [Candidatus Paceibacterota bacterium]